MKLATRITAVLGALLVTGVLSGCGGVASAPGVKGLARDQGAAQRAVQASQADAQRAGNTGVGP